MKATFLALFLAFLTTSGIFAQGTTTVAADPSGNTKVGIGKPLPDFSFIDVNGKAVTKATLPAGQPVIVFYFDPDCDHCQLESKWISEKKEWFKGITLLYVSWAEIEAIKEFPGKHLPGMTGNVLFTKDKDYKFDTYFGYSEIPSIYVYNRSWVRTASFKAETKPEYLVKFAWQ
jgi:hypothetical protein